MGREWIGLFGILVALLGQTAAGASAVYKGKFKVLGATPAECAFVFEKPEYEIRLIRLNNTQKVVANFRGKTGQEFLDGVNVAGRFGPDMDYLLERNVPLKTGGELRVRAEGVVTPRYLLMQLDGTKWDKDTERCTVTGEFSGWTR